MALIRNLFFLFTVTIFAIASLLLDVFNYNPFGASGAQFGNFYVSLFLSLAGINSFIIYYTRIKLNGEKLIFEPFWPSVRQGLFFGAAITVLLFLKGLRLLDWLVGLSIVFVTLLLELFFQTKRPSAKIKQLAGKQP